MKKRQNYSAYPSVLQITLSLALISISAGLASSVKASPASRARADTETALLPQDEEQPEVTCGAGNIRVEATNSGSNANYTTLQLAFAAINAGTHTGVINIG